MSVAAQLMTGTVRVHCRCGAEIEAPANQYDYIPELIRQWQREHSVACQYGDMEWGDMRRRWEAREAERTERLQANRDKQRAKNAAYRAKKAER